MAALPRIALQAKRHLRLKAGHPWAYSNEVEMTPAAKALAPGSPVTLVNAGGEPLGTALFNPHSLVAARLLTPEPDAGIDAGFLARRLERAQALRARLYERPYYRLAHAEADGFPGAVIDRFGDVAVVQLNAAGMDRLEGAVLDAVEQVLAPRAIILKNDSAVRALEGLGSEVRVARGSFEGPLRVEENGVTFLCDPVGGQKTGWFYDQRDNRGFVARFAPGGRVLDVYAYLGGFGLAAARAGAASVMLVDRSAPSLALAERAAAENGLAERVATVRAEAFAELERLGGAGKRFDVVVADPPAFVKSRKDLGPGSRAYRKLARLAAALVTPGGVLFIASCSHNVTPELFAEQVRGGLADARRNGRIVRAAGAAPDHPVHPFLPESAYLKGMVLVLD